MILPSPLSPWHIDGLTLRLLKPGEQVQLKQVSGEVLAALPCRRWYFSAEDHEFDQWVQNGEAVGYFDGETLAGFAVLGSWRTRGEHSYARMLGEAAENTYDFDDVMVRPAYRRRGIHTAFLSLFEQCVRSLGGCALYATVDPDNAPSYRNFERAGYRCVRTQSAYDGRPRRFYRLDL